MGGAQQAPLIDQKLSRRPIQRPPGVRADIVKSG